MTWGMAVAFAGYSGVLHHIQLASIDSEVGVGFRRVLRFSPSITTDDSQLSHNKVTKNEIPTFNRD